MRLGRIVIGLLILAVAYICLQTAKQNAKHPSIKPAESKHNITSSPETNSLSTQSQVIGPELKNIEPLLTTKESRKQCKLIIYLINKGTIEDPEQELKEFIKVSAHLPSIARIHWELGFFYEQNGDYNSAAEQYYSALALDSLTPSQDYQVRLRLIQIHANSYEEDLALEVLAQITNKYLSATSVMYTHPVAFPSPDKTYRMLAEALWRGGMLDEAIDYARLVAGSANKAQQQAAIVGAKAYAANGQKDEALDLLHAAIGDDPQSDTKVLSHVYLEMVRIALLFDDKESALHLAETGSTRLYNKDFRASFVFRLGDLFRKTGHNEWKEIMEEMAFSEEKGFRIGALEKLISTAKRNKQWGDVERYFQQMVILEERRGAKIVEDYLGLMESLQMQEKSIAGLMTSLTAFAETAQAKDIPALYRFGKEFSAAGEEQQALSFYEKILQFEEQDKWSFNTLSQVADILFRMGDIEGEREYNLKSFNEGALLGYSEQSIHSAIKILDSLTDSRNSHLKFKMEEGVAEQLHSIDDPASLSRLVVFFQNRNLSKWANESLDRMSRLLAELPDKVSLAEKVEYEKMYMDRLLEMGFFTKMVSRYEYLVGNGTINQSRYNREVTDLEFNYALSLYKDGNESKALDVFNELIQKTQNDVEAYPYYAVALGELLLYSGIDYDILSLFRSAVEKNNSHPSSAVARIYLIVDSIKHNDYKELDEMADRIISDTDPSSKLSWVRSAHWSGHYLRGMSMARSGSVVEGRLLMKEAMDNADVWTEVLELHEKL